MKKNKLFLLALIFALPFSFMACSDDDNKDPLPDPDPTDTVPAVQAAIKFRLPDFSKSGVYLVQDGEKTVAEVTVEYVPTFSKSNRATVVYPYGTDGKVDHTKGYVVNNGGSLSWNSNGTYSYTPGSTQASLVLYVDSCKVSTSIQKESKEVTPVADVMKDADNNEYKVVKVGAQYWMGENLKSTKLGNGSALATNLTPAQWCENTTGAYLTYTMDTTGNGGVALPDDLSSPEKIKANYGLLYSWNAAKNVAPQGWHLPAATEWESLRLYLGDTVGIEAPAAGGMLKETGLTHWNSATGWDDDNNEVELGNVGATNVTGFSAVGGGYVYSVYSDMNDISFGSIKNEGAWFTSSDEDGYVIYFGISNSYASLDDNYGEMSGAMSVRLVRD